MRRMHSSSLLLFALFAVVLSIGCSNSAGPISINLSSSATQTDQGQAITVTANLANDTSGRRVTWTLSGPGTLMGQTTTTSAYTAPATVATSQKVTITATSVANPAINKSLQITINPPPLILFQTLAIGTVGTLYNQPIVESGGSPPFVWSLEISALPTGLSLNPASGVVTGAPTGGGTWYFWVHVVDAAGLFADQPFLSIAINPSGPSGNPVPFVNQPLIPDAVSPDAAPFTLTVNGTGFVSGASVTLNGAPLPTTFVTSRQLTAAVPASAVSTAGTELIAVNNPTPDGGASNAVFLPVAVPEAALNFSPATGSPIPADEAVAVTVGDFNGDGKPDFAVAYNIRVGTFLGNGDGTFTQAPGSPVVIAQPPWDTLPSPYTQFLATGDFDNSGKLGLAVAGLQSSDAAILLGNGNGSFTPSTTFAYIQGQPTISLAPGDFNGDGNLDFAATNQFNGIPLVVELGYGDGAFTPVSYSPFGVPSGATAVAVGDFNGDGKLDLVVSSGNSLTILLGNGDGTFTPTPSSPLAISPSFSIVVADFNGDGKLDLAVANVSANTVTIMLGNGDGTFNQASGSPIPVGNEPYSIAAGDFTGTGKLGLAIANYGSNTVTILLGNGDGTFTQPAGSPIPVGKGPYSLAVADFNGSGRLGLAVANLTDGTVSVLVQH